MVYSSNCIAKSLISDYELNCKKHGMDNLWTKVILETSYPKCWHFTKGTGLKYQWNLTTTLLCLPCINKHFKIKFQILSLFLKLKFLLTWYFLICTLFLKTLIHFWSNPFFCSRHRCGLLSYCNTQLIILYEESKAEQICLFQNSLRFQ